MVSKSFADTVEIIGRTRLLGEEQGRTIDAQQREAEARSAQAAESMRAAQAESDLRKAKKENKALKAQLATPSLDEKAGKEKEELKASLTAAEVALAERDAIITEWMHSAEAFRRLQRQYGKKLGMTDEERQVDFDNAIRDLAEEDPRFSNTELVRNLKR